MRCVKDMSNRENTIPNPNIYSSDIACIDRIGLIREVANKKKKKAKA